MLSNGSGSGGSAWSPRVSPRCVAWASLPRSRCSPHLEPTTSIGSPPPHRDSDDGCGSPAGGTGDRIVLGGPAINRGWRASLLVREQFASDDSSGEPL